MNPAQGRALVIDDNPHVRRLLGDLLEVLGYQVRGAADGADGLALLQQGRYDLLVTDLMMPGLTGWEVVEAVRRDDPDIGIVMATGSVGNIDTKRLEELHVILVTKPFAPQELTADMNNALRIAGHASIAAEHEARLRGPGSAQGAVGPGVYVEWLGQLRAVAATARTYAETFGQLINLAEETVRERDELRASFAGLQQEHDALREAHDELILARKANAEALAKLQSEHETAVRKLRDAREQSQTLAQQREWTLRELLRILQSLRTKPRGSEGVSGQ